MTDERNAEFQAYYDNVALAPKRGVASFVNGLFIYGAILVGVAVLIGVVK